MTVMLIPNLCSLLRCVNSRDRVFQLRLCRFFLLVARSDPFPLSHISTSLLEDLVINQGISGLAFRLAMKDFKTGARPERMTLNFFAVGCRIGPRDSLNLCRNPPSYSFSHLLIV